MLPLLPLSTLLAISHTHSRLFHTWFGLDLASPVTHTRLDVHCLCIIINNRVCVCVCVESILNGICIKWWWRQRRWYRRLHRRAKAKHTSELAHDIYQCFIIYLYVNDVFLCVIFACRIRMGNRQRSAEQKQRQNKRLQMKKKVKPIRFDVQLIYYSD